MQLGFVIDHSRCIGCHACTVACKSENDVPLGSFRTWVKYTEEGQFPQVKRSFAVLRCNQCTKPPCVDICPTGALKKGADGIVDINPAACIGCKSCMHGCPYDALYINPDTGTAQKCHFCAHRTEVGLAPACAVVCPTEAIIPGDFDDPNSRVSQLRKAGATQARKVEAGTGPNVFYKEVAEAGIQPNLTSSAGGYLWSQPLPNVQLQAERALQDELEAKAKARTVYNVDHPPLWGGKIVGYLFTKSLAAGLFLAALPLVAPFGGALGGGALLAVLALALFFLTATTGLLIGDLKRPDRFYYLLTRGNWKSWLVKGTVFLMGYGALLSLYALLVVLGQHGSGFGQAVAFLTLPFATGAAVYTAWLFGQAKGRVFWMKRGLAAQLFGQALLAGGAGMLLLVPLLGLDAESAEIVRWIACLGLALHGLFTLAEAKLSPPKREVEYARVAHLISHGIFAKRHWGIGVALGLVLPAVLWLVPVPALWTLGALAALIGLYSEEDLLVRAGQALPIS
ncbi:MAG: polysulfide reductase NrfD [Planctomycetes bacterium]|nr:polysulfide reductase NrfD [Planctomycetota bacterium]